MDRVTNARLAVLVVSAAMVVGLLSGVGSAAPEVPLTKLQYVAVYNALCEASIVKAQAAIQGLSKNHTSSDFIAAIAPIYKDGLKKSRKLVPPLADRKRVKLLLAAQQTALDTAKQDDNTEIIGGNGGKGPKPKSDQLAEAYGLESGTCVNPTARTRANSPAPGPAANGNTGPTDTMPCPGVGPCAGDNSTPPAPT